MVLAVDLGGTGGARYPDEWVGRGLRQLYAHLLLYRLREAGPRYFVCYQHHGAELLAQPA